MIIMVTPVIFAVLLCELAIGNTEVQNPLSDEFIDLINSKQNSWKAGRNFSPDTPLKNIIRLLGVLNNHIANLPKVKHDAEFIATLPEQFDARHKWTNCPSLNEIRDQGSCGSCWAFAAVEAMTDRFCIFSNGTQQFRFSAEDLLSCCSDCGFGCGGGDLLAAWNYWKTNGIVSGGSYNSNEGCAPYLIPPCEHHTNGTLPKCEHDSKTPECKKSCDPHYNVDYSKDKHFGDVIYSIDSNEEHIKADLFKFGPVEASFTVYPDFIHYKSGVYQHTHGPKIGFHAVKIFGWGVEDGHKYWLVANSWNTHWGDKGYFKILRGVNHCGIEETVVSGKPLLK